jgi:hypothetical protein
MAVNPNIELANKLKERFEFYVIALTFTILGLSIQTAKFGSYIAPDILELLGWAFLFISGLVGLSRLEWLPVAYKVFGELDKKTAEINQLKQAKESGRTNVPVIGDGREFAPVDEVINKYSLAESKLDLQIKKLIKWTLIKYQIHKWAFVLGLFFLLASRSYEPIRDIAISVNKAINT